ncbi:hypothetical protein Q9189_001728 [Teloschistes chrysophthalmus]
MRAVSALFAGAKERRQQLMLTHAAQNWFANSGEPHQVSHCPKFQVPSTLHLKPFRSPHSDYSFMALPSLPHVGEIFLRKNDILPTIEKRLEANPAPQFLVLQLVTAWVNAVLMA